MSDAKDAEMIEGLRISAMISDNGLDAVADRMSGMQARIEKLESAILMVLPKLDQVVKWGRLHGQADAAAERAETVKGLLEYALKERDGE